MAFDAYLTGVARLFLKSLPPEEKDDCIKAILDVLCHQAAVNDPLEKPSPFPSVPGVAERVVGDWYFRYLIENATTLKIATIYYSPNNPKHGLYG